MHAFSKLYHADFVCLSKGQTFVVLSSIFCLNPVPNVYSTTPVEVFLELLFLTRNPSLLVLKIYGKAHFLKMLTDVDHDNLRTVLFKRLSSIVGGFRPFFLGGRKGGRGGRKGGAHILRGRTLIRISCPDWSNCVRTPRDVHTVAA